MTIYVNDKPFIVDQGTTITGLLHSMDISSFNGIAIGIGNQVVPRKDWETKILKENDNVLLIRASQGG